jgi:hypothetical protein
MSQQKLSGTQQLSSANLDGVLVRFLGLIPDARQITISTKEGAELLSETRMGANAEDSHTISSLAPSFNMSVEQSSRLGLGGSQYAMTWTANSVLMQTKIKALVVSILLDENANLGVAQEHIDTLREILAPFCDFDNA